MGYQTEEELEDNFIETLSNQGYEYVEKIHNIEDLQANLKEQLEKLNKSALKGTKLTDEEFKKILIYLESGTIFDKAKKLRDYFKIERENEYFHIKFLDQKDWCHNIFQVAHQINVNGRHKNRYDVTILINGFPLVQIELKRRGMQIKEAFNQIKRYDKDSFKGLFGYIQIFVISNGVDTKYFANDKIKQLNFSSTFFWKDKDNNNIYDLEEFTHTFLERCHISKMITKYMVLNESEKRLMVLRSYQKYAVEAIINQAIQVKQNGYIWHSTGSGKTLTSYKASQLLAEEEDIYKVIFVVDRRDLDNQTSIEFNKFQEDSINTTDNTKQLIDNLTSENKGKLVLTTIQKLHNATKSKYDKEKLEKIKDKNIILIFDECHRSQFGEMHNDITTFFKNALCYGFTGTPIFVKNSTGSKTTKDIFTKRLHQYLIKDAIDDGNVLGFSVDYFDDSQNDHSKLTEEELESDKRLEKIVKTLIDTYDIKTHNKKFNAIFAVPSIEVLHKYYKKFKELDHDLKIATIFSYQDNEDLSVNEIPDRDKLDEYIKDYNKQFKTNYSSDSLQQYQSDISKRMKENDLDLLIVVRMFLTGFDSQLLNTLYLDQSIKYHTLLQAMSRTNRIYDDTKSQGNIVSFRDIKDDVDESLITFSDGNPAEDIILPPYETLTQEFNTDYKVLKNKIGSVNDVGELETDNDKAKFISLFKKLATIKNKLDIFSQFTFDDLDMDEEEFYDYKSKYLDIYDYKRRTKDPTSALYDIDFEIDLLRNDQINVEYIINLMNESIVNPVENENGNREIHIDKERILGLIDQNAQLRNKKELISEFIDVIEEIKYKEDLNVFEEFDLFMQRKKEEELNKKIEDQDLDEEKIKEIYTGYEYSNKLKNDDLWDCFNYEPKFIERCDLVEEIKDFLINLNDKFTY